MALIDLFSGGQVIVDDVDFPLVSNSVWYRSGKYAVKNVRVCVGKWMQISMHRLVSGCREGMVVDHIDGNGLNNSRANLRICTSAENGKNRKLSRSNKSWLKGVSFCAKTGKWLASIKHEGKSRHLGYFTDPNQAHKAYTQAAILMHGEFANPKGE